MRDLLGAMVALVAVVLVIGGLTRGCAFAPGGPTTDPAAGPSVDAPAQLRALASGTAFSLRVPAVPSGWRATAVGTVQVEPAGQAGTAAGAGFTGHRAVRTGYVTPAGRYLRVVQSDAAEADLLAEEAQDAGAPPQRAGSRASGPVDVGGTRWLAYDDGTREPLWTAQVDGVQLLITGSGDDDEFRALAAATTGGEVLPR
jgi:hypothetical protein